MYRVTLHYDGKTVAAPLLARHTVLGSSTQADIQLPVAHVSRRHAEIVRDRDHFILRDLDSHNGTFVRGARIDEIALTPLTEFALGPVVGMIEEVSTGDFQTGLALEMLSASPSPPMNDATQTAELPSQALLTSQIMGPLMRAAGLDRASVARQCGREITARFPQLALRIESRARADANEPTVVLFDSCSTTGPLSIASASTSSIIDLPGRDSPGLRVSWAGQVPRALRNTMEVMASVLASLDDSLDDSRPPRPPNQEPAAEVLPRRRSGVIGRSQPIHALLSYCERIAPMPINLLILGESGTGKELFAREIHELSVRKSAPFVAINCAALPRDLLEAELFGIEEKVATGVDARSGRFEQAHGGTLFLDELCDMSLSTQAMMLRVLQEKSFYPIGGRDPRSVDVRIVAATNKNIEEEISERRFRQDLYYRIAGDTLCLPPLRERSGDISVLLHHFLEHFSRKLERPIAGVSQKALDRLVAYQWPGNVRELENEACRLVALAPVHGLIEAAHLSPRIRAITPEPAHRSEVEARPLQEALAVFERGLVEDALARAKGNIAAAARELGISRPGLYQRMERLGIDGGRSR